MFLDDLVVTQSAAGAYGPGFNSPVTGTHLQFNILSGLYSCRQAVLAVGCTVTTNCNRICSVAANTCGLILRRRTWHSITNERLMAHLSTRLANLLTAPRGCGT